MNIVSALRPLSLGLLLTVSGLSGCFGRTVSEHEEIEASMATMVWLDEQYGVVRNRELNQLLSRISKRLAGAVYGAALESRLSSSTAEQFANYPWQVYVINTRDVNAFTTGAGVVILTAGMIANTRTEAELATIISHEMAHQLLGHTRHALGAAEPNQSAPGVQFSLNDEVAADRLGLKILHVARYDISQAPNALSIGYQPVNGAHSAVPADWLTKRMSLLHQEIAGVPAYLPATASTREFSRVRKKLIEGLVAQGARAEG